jgi:hypothetical protein
VVPALRARCLWLSQITFRVRQSCRPWINLKFSHFFFIGDAIVSVGVGNSDWAKAPRDLTLPHLREVG